MDHTGKIMKTNYQFWILILLTFFGAVAEAQTKPNILWILTDDQRYDSIQAFNRILHGRDESELGYSNLPTWTVWQRWEQRSSILIAKLKDVLHRARRCTMAATHSDQEFTSSSITTITPITADLPCQRPWRRWATKQHTLENLACA